MKLKITSLNKYYTLSGGEKFHALKNVNLTFNMGESVAIVGESGSGKSTLMNIIGGLDRDYLGQIFLGNDNITKFNELQLDDYRKKSVGFIFQSFNLINHLSVLDNVSIALTLSGEKDDVKIQKAKYALEQVGLFDQIKKKPNQLSGGQKQRVAIARAIVNDPDIIIADEPTGALDSQTTLQILKILQSIALKGKMVLMVTHSQKVAESCDRIVKISDGEIVEDTLKNVIEDTSAEEKINYKTNKLSFVSSCRLAVKNMLSKATRNILVSAGVAIGVMSVIMMLGFNVGVKSFITKTMNSYTSPNIVEVKMQKDINNENPGAGAMGFLQPDKFFEDADIEKITNYAINNNKVETIERGVTIISMSGNTLKFGDKSSNILYVQTITNGLSPEYIVKGKMPTNQYEIMVSNAVEKDIPDIVGKTLSLTVVIDTKTISHDVVVSGTYESYNNNQFVSSFNILYVNYLDLETLANENSIEFKPNAMYITAKNSDNAELIKTDMKNLGFAGSSGEQLLGMFNKMLDVMTAVLLIIAGISLLVSAIMIFVVQYISVTERTKEIGTLKSIGARRKDIKRIFTTESFMLGVMSSVFSIVFSLIFTLIINIISKSLFGVGVIGVVWWHYLIGVSIAIIISMLAGLYPASKAAKLDPVESLARE